MEYMSTKNGGKGGAVVNSASLAGKISCCFYNECLGVWHRHKNYLNKNGLIFSTPSLIAEHLNIRQLILHWISPSVCVCVCVRVTLQEWNLHEAMCNGSYTRHTPARCLHTCNARAHTTIDAATGWTATIELDVLLPLGKGSRGKHLRQITYWLQLPPMTITFHMLSHSLFFHTI